MGTDVFLLTKPAGSNSIQRARSQAKANTARLALFAQQTGGGAAAGTPMITGTPMISCFVQLPVWAARLHRLLQGWLKITFNTIFH